MDFYVILGLGREATGLEIKRAYRRLARKFHPDINPGDHAAKIRFQQIAEAYETLIDPDRRHRYDRDGTWPGATEPPAAVFEGFDFSVAGHAEQAPTFGDLFAEVFRPAAGSAGSDAVRGSDLHSTLTLEFEEAMAGVTRSVTVTRREPCTECGGSGSLQMAQHRCPRCQGTGALRSVRGHMVFSRSCGECGGTGHERRRTCGACGGQGLRTRGDTVAVPVPPGVRDGAHLRLGGRGDPGRFGGPAGDLLIEVQVSPHPLFRREGDDIHLVMPVALHEAALGARIDVPTLEGPARLRIPPGTQAGQRLRLRERGVPSPRDRGRGDLIVEVRLVLPASLDERSKALLKEFGEINAGDVRGPDWVKGRGPRSA